MIDKLDMTDMVLKALADPTRRKVLDLLFADNGQTLTALCQDLGMTRQSASQHIEILIDANLVTTVKNGREKLHYLNPVPIHEVYARWVHKFEERPLDRLRQLKNHLESDLDE